MSLKKNQKTLASVRQVVNFARTTVLFYQLNGICSVSAKSLNFFSEM